MKGAFVGYMYVVVFLNSAYMYMYMHFPCINFKDSACPAELPRWLSWWSIYHGVMGLSPQSFVREAIRCT